MRPATLRPIILLVLILILAACTHSFSENQGFSSPQVTLLPYRTTVSNPTPPEISEAAILPSATPEPVTYTVVAGDSLSAIAFRFGVDLNALILANPGVNANAMSIGMKLVIPETGAVGGGDISSTNGLPTPVINSDGKPDCYPLEDGRWMCFLLVKNTLDQNIGNITGQVKITGLPVVFTATSPLDVVTAGETVPLIAWIEGREINPEAMTGSLTSAVTLDQVGSHYEGIQVAEHVETYQPNRRSVIIDGMLTPPSSGILRVLAYALDKQRHVIGFRIWESSDSVPAGQEQPFQIYIYSLEGTIAGVHLLAQTTLQR
jgi:hypothetical protein